MRKGEYHSHDLLEMAAYGILGLQRTKENEEKVLNLHNHLIWKSYERGKDDVTDAIMDEAERLAELAVRSAVSQIQEAQGEYCHIQERR